MPTSSNPNSDASDEPPVEIPESSSALKGRKLVFAIVAVPLVGLVSLLIWGLAQTGGAGGRPGVNNSLGEVSFEARPAVDFEITLFNSENPSGGTLRLSDLRGKVVMVDFWSSWCPPCRAEAPTLAQVYRDYEGQPVEFVGIDIWDTENGARDYLSRYGVTFPTGEDPQGRIAVEYGLSGIPEKYFIDGDGIIKRKFIGPMNRDALVDLLDQFLKELEVKQLQELSQSG